MSVGPTTLGNEIDKIGQLFVYRSFGYVVRQDSPSTCQYSEFLRKHIIPQRVTYFSFALKRAETSRAAAKLICPSFIFGDRRDA